MNKKLGLGSVLFFAVTSLYTLNVKAQSPKVSNQVKRDILQQMLRDRVIDNSCQNKTDGFFVSYPYTLGGGKNVYLIDVTLECGYRTLLYEKRNTQYTLIFNANNGAHMELGKAKTSTNGYPDVMVYFFSGQSYEDRLQNTYKFDGKRYNLVKCESCDGVRGQQGKVISKCVPTRCQ